ncbi:MAG: 8-oxo-dGTP diphosphatase [Candidatus Saccharibacteria bacterium]
MAKVCTLVFLRRDDQILLAMKKRGFGEGLWNGVGGKVDADETIEQAMIRECQEEISVTPTSFTKIAERDFINDAAREPWRMIVHVYFCTDWTGEPTESEEMAPKWYAVAEIPYATMWQDDQMWLPLSLQGKKVKSTFTFDEHDDILSAQISVVPTV